MRKLYYQSAELIEFLHTLKAAVFIHFADFSVKLSTIRIWMHEKDIGKLTRILWAGQGSRLCQQASTNPRVKRFLAAVPYVMVSKIGQ